MLESMRVAFRAVPQTSPGGRLVERDGVLATVAPAVPERSLPNSVVYESEDALIGALDELEAQLARQRYLAGSAITEADWRLFPTLVRFDAVYYSHFKCNLRRIVDYPNLSNYLRDLYQQPGIAATVDIGQIKLHYYGSQRHVNPFGIVPLGPELDFSAAHDRGRFS
jgi:putative glutathione S-transferase